MVALALLPLDHSIVKDIGNFLASNRHISRINFCLSLSKTYKVYPSAYRKDVRLRIAGGGIGIVIDPALDLNKPSPTHVKRHEAVDARYDFANNLIHIGKNFNISSSRKSQQSLIHECTHAHFDIQAIGPHLAIEEEAAAYLANAIFLLSELNFIRPYVLEEARKSIDEIETASYPIAAKIYDGTYLIGRQELAGLLYALAKGYGANSQYNSNGVGFRRKPKAA